MGGCLWEAASGCGIRWEAVEQPAKPLSGLAGGFAVADENKDSSAPWTFFPRRKLDSQRKGLSRWWGAVNFPLHWQRRRRLTAGLLGHRLKTHDTSPNRPVKARCGVSRATVARAPGCANERHELIWGDVGLSAGGGRDATLDAVHFNPLPRESLLPG